MTPSVVKPHQVADLQPQARRLVVGEPGNDRDQGRAPRRRTFRPHPGKVIEFGLRRGNELNLPADRCVDDLGDYSGKALGLGKEVRHVATRLARGEQGAADHQPEIAQLVRFELVDIGVEKLLQREAGRLNDGRHLSPEILRGHGCSGHSQHDSQGVPQ